MKVNQKEIKEDLRLQIALRKGESVPKSWKQGVCCAVENAEQVNVQEKNFCKGRRIAVILALVLLLPAGAFGAYQIVTDDNAPMITDAEAGDTAVRIKDGFMTAADDENMEFQFNVSVKKGDVEQIQLTTDRGLLLIPKVISEEEFERLEKLPGEIDGLSRNNGVCRVFRWSEGRQTVSFDPKDQSKEMYTHESIALRIRKKDVENAALQMKIIEKSGKVTEKEIYAQYDQKEHTAFLRFSFQK